MSKILAGDVLRGQPTVTTSDVSHAEKKIRDLFGEHKLRPHARGALIDMKLRSVHRGSVGIQFLDYGADVDIVSEAQNDFYLVQIPLEGRARLQVNSSMVESRNSVAAIPPLEEPFTMTWGRGTPHLIVYVQRLAMEHAADCLFGPDRPDLALGLSMDLKSVQGRAFVRSVIELQGEMAGEPARVPEHLHRLLAETMLSRLLMATVGPLEPAAPTGGAVERGRMARNFNDLLERHGAEELAISDIAESLGVSMRTLQAVVRSELGETPSNLLRRSRLTRARELLLTADANSDNVTSIAIKVGFTHLSRFSSAYFQAFGELPSETLRR
ncbi:AraC family transcriptional regulator [Paenarthrobacter sp. NPDC090522]|uniref:AraC family transcriptional regulator n=1 Tax=Paenarthrobacter sp. NPDC090522 TaxID=3364383 RepID=UPI003828E1E0